MARMHDCPAIIVGRQTPIHIAITIAVAVTAIVAARAICDLGAPKLAYSAR